MKEVKKCSISGIAFTLDADAYALLSRYDRLVINISYNVAV